MLTQVLALGFTQTIAWAASTYLIAILAAPIARDLGLSTATVFGAFSIALVVMGRAGSRQGARPLRRRFRSARAHPGHERGLADHGNHADRRFREHRRLAGH